MGAVVKMFRLVSTHIRDRITMGNYQDYHSKMKIDEQGELSEFMAEENDPTMSTDQKPIYQRLYDNIKQSSPLEKRTWIWLLVVSIFLLIVIMSIFIELTPGPPQGPQGPQGDNKFGQDLVLLVNHNIIHMILRLTLNPFQLF